MKSPLYHARLCHNIRRSRFFYKYESFWGEWWQQQKWKLATRLLLTPTSVIDASRLYQLCPHIAASQKETGGDRSFSHSLIRSIVNSHGIIYFFPFAARPECNFLEIYSYIRRRGGGEACTRPMGTTQSTACLNFNWVQMRIGRGAVQWTCDMFKVTITKALHLICLMRLDKSKWVR